MSLITAINISVISDDPIFINRIKIFSQNSDINFTFIKKAQEGPPADLFLIDAYLLEQFREDKNYPAKIKFIVRGKQKELKPAFDAGCIDFLKTPCDMEELEIRLSNVFNFKPGIIRWEDIILNQNNIASESFSIDISIEEHIILKTLIQNRGEPVPREVLYYALPGNHKKDSRVVDMHVSNLRKKIRQLRKNQKSCCSDIKTVRSYGYLIY